MRDFRLACFCLLTLAGLLGCDKKDTHKVKITVKIDSAKNARVDIATYNLLDLDTMLLASSTLDSTGSGSLEMEIAGPGSAFKTN